tara:strand:+ start:101 stop:250 length:150 start_codon:yes stop_codon:yes gene_type:complete
MFVYIIYFFIFLILIYVILIALKAVSRGIEAKKNNKLKTKEINLKKDED